MIFLSTFTNTIDQKGRVVLPKEFRIVLQNFNGFVAFRSHKLNAVDCFSMDRMEKLSKQIDDTLDPFSIERDSIESAVFADAVILRFDKDGRIIIPEALLNHAAIEEKISFVGLGATFQLWNPRAFEEHQNLVRAKLKNKVTV
jgi:MraZ protein